MQSFKSQYPDKLVIGVFSLFSYSALVEAIMCFTLATLGFLLKYYKIRNLAISYCALGIPCFLFGIIIGPLQLSSYSLTLGNDICYDYFLSARTNKGKRIYAYASELGSALIAASLLAFFSCIGSYFYISDNQNESTV